MKILFTCGGTAGHINPAVALAGMFRERNHADILFVGADGGMERQLVPREGYPIPHRHHHQLPAEAERGGSQA